MIWPAYLLYTWAYILIAVFFFMPYKYLICVIRVECVSQKNLSWRIYIYYYKRCWRYQSAVLRLQKLLTNAQKPISKASFNDKIQRLGIFKVESVFLKWKEITMYLSAKLSNSSSCLLQSILQSSRPTCWYSVLSASWLHYCNYWSCT